MKRKVMRRRAPFRAAIAAMIAPSFVTARGLDSAFAVSTEELVDCSDDSRSITWNWHPNNLPAYDVWQPYVTTAIADWETSRRWYDATRFFDFIKVTSNPGHQIRFEDLGSSKAGDNVCSGGNLTRINTNLDAIGVPPSSASAFVKSVAAHELGHRMGLEHTQGVGTGVEPNRPEMFACDNLTYSLTPDDRAHLAYVHRNGDPVWGVPADSHVLFANAGFDEVSSDGWHGSSYLRFSQGGYQSAGRGYFLPTSSTDYLWQSRIVVDGNDDPTYDAVYAFNGSPAESESVQLYTELLYKTIDISTAGGTGCGFTGNEPVQFPDGLDNHNLDSWTASQYSAWISRPVVTDTVAPGGLGWIPKVYGSFRPADTSTNDAVLLQLRFSEVPGKGAPFTTIYLDSASAIARDPGVD